MADGVEETDKKHCAFFLKRKQRFCRMTVGEGKKYCGEHMIVGGEAEVGVDFYLSDCHRARVKNYALLLLANFTKAYTLLLLLFYLFNFCFDRLAVAKE